jgi:hypothetical protein
MANVNNMDNIEEQLMKIDVINIDPVDKMNYFAYKRLNHFNEILSQFREKNNTVIPQEVYNIIQLEMKNDCENNLVELNNNVSQLMINDCENNLAYLNNNKVRGYLKKHKYNKYYEYIPQIINRLNGISYPTFSPQMEEELRIMFQQIQEPFEKCRPPDRTSFFNYNFVLYKFCQLKGWNEFLGYFPSLKSKDNLYEHEQMWKKICDDLGW